MRIMLVTDDEQLANGTIQALAGHTVHRMTRAQAVSVGSAYDAVVLDGDTSGTATRIAGSLRERRCAQRAILLGEIGEPPEDPATTVLARPCTAQDLLAVLAEQPPAEPVERRRRRTRERMRERGLMDGLTGLFGGARRRATGGRVPTQDRQASRRATHGPGATHGASATDGLGATGTEVEIEAEVEGTMVEGEGTMVEGETAVEVDAAAVEVDAAAVEIDAAAVEVEPAAVEAIADPEPERTSTDVTSLAAPWTRTTVPPRLNGGGDRSTPPRTPTPTSSARTIPELIADPEAAPLDPRVDVIASVLEAETRSILTHRPGRRPVNRRRDVGRG
jgi:hypothetical protein